MKRRTAEFRRGVRAVRRLIDNYDLPENAEYWLKQRIATLLAKPKRKRR